MTTSAGAVVRVAMGPRVGERRFIAPGARLTVGRAERADFAFPQDPALSGLHAELAWDGPTLVLRDRESLGGTTLGGERVPPGTAVPVPDGAWVSVGSTSLLVRHEVTAPGPARLPLAFEAQLLAALTPHVGSLFAVLDGAQGDAIHEALDTHRDEARSLYEGPKGEALARVAPHLVRLDPGSSLLHHVVRQGHGLAWGIFLRCRRPFAEVRRRLRRYLVVTEDSTSRRMYFRYYDPRVAREILPILTLRQEDEFFGDELEEVFAEGEDGSLLAFSRGQRHGRVVVPPSGPSLEDTHAHP